MVISFSFILALILTIPKGIGFTILGNDLGLDKILLLIIFPWTFSFLKKNDLNKYILVIVLLIFFTLFSGYNSWISGLFSKQLLFFIYDLIFISFFLSLFILSSLLVIDNIGFERSFKLSILTLTNTVNSEMYSLQNFNFANLLTSSKTSLIIFMIIGKIELISVFLIFKKLILKD